MIEEVVRFNGNGEAMHKIHRRDEATPHQFLCGTRVNPLRTSVVDDVIEQAIGSYFTFCPECYPELTDA